ncbi:MAG: hypothetical protein WCA96_12670 [Methylocella sp.]
MMRVHAKFFTPRFAALHLEESLRTVRPSRQSNDSRITSLHLETDNQHAKPLVWTKAEMYQYRVKGSGISQPSSGLLWLPLASR